MTSSGEGIQAQLDVSELMGSESYLYSSVGDTQLVARVQSTHQQKTGDMLNFTPQFENLHFFDPETGARVN